MEQAIADRLVLDAVLVVVMSVVLAWVEFRSRHDTTGRGRDAVTNHPDHQWEPRAARYRRPVVPGRRAA